MRASIFALSLTLATASAHAAAPSPDVELFVEPTMLHAAEDVGALFRSRTGVAVRFFSAPSSMLIHEIPFTLCDVMILQGAAVMDQAIRDKAADPESRLPLGRNHLVLAARGATAASSKSFPDIAANGPIAVVDAPVPDALGALSHQILDPAGWPGAGGRILGVATGADASFLLGTGEARLAVLYRTDVAADDTLSVVAALPDGPVVAEYAASLSMSVNSPNARAFLDFLRSPEARAKLRADGLDIAP